MASGKRENTQTYIEKVLGANFKMIDRTYSCNDIIKRTTVRGKGDAYRLGERLNRLAAKGEFKTDLGVLSSHDVGMTEGSAYDEVSMVFEELLNKNRYGFSVYTNLRVNAASIPLSLNTYELSGSSYEQTKSPYKYYWDHSIYTKESDQKTVTSAEYTAWQAAGYNTTLGVYDDIKTGLNSSDVSSGAIRIIKNGERPPSDYILAVFADGDNSGKAVLAKLPNTQTFYFGDFSIVQTVYCESESKLMPCKSSCSLVTACRLTSIV